MMRVDCYLEDCNEPAGGYSVESPNLDQGWCKECHQQIGSITLTYYFCTPEHALQWLQEHIQSLSESAINTINTEKENANKVE